MLDRTEAAKRSLWQVYAVLFVICLIWTQVPALARGTLHIGISDVLAALILAAIPTAIYAAFRKVRAR